MSDTLQTGKAAGQIGLAAPFVGCALRRDAAALDPGPGTWCYCFNSCMRRIGLGWRRIVRTISDIRPVHIRAQLLTLDGPVRQPLDERALISGQLAQSIAPKSHGLGSHPQRNGQFVDGPQMTDGPPDRRGLDTIVMLHPINSTLVVFKNLQLCINISLRVFMVGALCQ